MRYLPSSRQGGRPAAVAAEVALLGTVLAGVAALVLDGGLMQAERRRGQAAADAAALAAAVDLANNYGSLSSGTPDGGTSAKANAVKVASANYGNYSNDGTAYTFTTDNGNTCTVTVNIPPTSGQFTDSSQYLGYVEVIVQYNQPRYFSGIFGSGTVPIKARAVGRGKYGTQYTTVNILALDKSAGSALSLQGSKTIVSVPGAIVVDSNSTTAVAGVGTAVSGSAVKVVGTITSSNVYAPTSGSKANVSSNSPAYYVSDPLSSLPVPSTSGLTVWSRVPYTISSGTLQPGIYQGGIVVSGGTVTMASGLYYIEGGGLTVTSAKTTLDGTAGVLIYNGEMGGSTTSPSSVGSISISGNAVVKLAPMTFAQLSAAGLSAAYAGISIFQDRNATASLTIDGNTGTNISGAVYAAKAAATITGGSDITPGAAFITDTLTVAGNSSFTLPVSPIPITTTDPSSHDVRLVE
jgi:Flp pilus assembly protein TadG